MYFLTTEVLTARTYYEAFSEINHYCYHKRKNAWAGHCVGQVFHFSLIRIYLRIQNR